MTAQRFIATLEWYTGEKGYGFMVDIDGKKEFVSYTPLAGDGFHILTEGNRFEFCVETGPRGLFASQIVGLR